MKNLNVPEFKLSEAATAAGSNTNTIHGYLRKGFFQISDGDIEASRGGTHKITLRRVYQIAVALALMEADLVPARAFKAATAFTDRAPDANARERPDGTIEVQRLPGQLYHHKQGKTYLIVTADRETCVPIGRKTTVQEVLSEVIYKGKFPTTFTALDVTAVVWRVHNHLGLSTDGL